MRTKVDSDAHATPSGREDLRIGVENLLDNYARVGRYDYVVVAYTPDSRVHAARLCVNLEQRGNRWVSVPMVPMIDPGFAARLNAILPDEHDFSGNMVVITLERDTMSHFEALTPVFGRYGIARTKIVRVISSTDEFFSHALQLTPRELEQRNATLLTRLRGEHEFRVTTAGGTDLMVGLDQSKYDWISNRGVLRPGAFTILPPGEIATYPASINGVLVADGAINCNVICDLDMRLSSAPITFEIVDSVIQSYDCPRDDLAQFLKKSFNTPHATKVGELGFGTNAALPGFIAHNSHLNERRPGLHIGFGQHNQPLSVVPYDARMHIDIITDGATLHLTNGEVDLANLVVDPAAEHPALIRDEDVTGDCCSSGCQVVVL